ncbi:BspA family leucine-rich repeat surface protein [Mycoplasma agalactiae]|nr:BspA family leucine-rich repeat surface protein [Mycoplasmopsis agalactiae]
MLFASSLPLIAASCKNNETKEPKKAPEMDVPIAPPTDPGKTEPMHSDELKVLKTNISGLKLEFSPTNNTNKSEVLELLKKQPKLENLTESDFDFKLEQKSLLNREGRITIKANQNSEIIEGQFEIKIEKLKSVAAKEHVYNKDKTEVLEIGYDSKGIIKRFDTKVKKVSAKLPEEVISLYRAFENNENETIENLGKWDTSNIENMSQVFFRAKNFNTDISSWKTDKVEDMSYMFYATEKFNINLDKWNTASVKNMNRMFQEAKMFNGNVSSWKTQNVTNMEHMFEKATAFNQDLSSWNVENVSKMKNMFSGAKEFNKPLFKLINPKVSDMSYMFYGAEKFNNSNISNWNTSSVTDIRSMFRGATEFNQNLNWKTENITNMSNLFAEASKFNGDITKWNTSNVVDMKGMFQKAIAFNKDISGWNIKKVKDVSFMFDYAYKFDHSLKKWEFEQGTANNNFANATKLHNNSDKLPVFKTTKAK